MMGKYTEAEIKEIENDRDWWNSLAPPDWQVTAFTYRQSANFALIGDDKFLKSASFEPQEVDFLLDVLGRSRNEVFTNWGWCQVVPTGE